MECQVCRKRFKKGDVIWELNCRNRCRAHLKCLKSTPIFPCAHCKLLGILKCRGKAYPFEVTS